MAIDWTQLAKIGTSLYDMYNKNQIADDFRQASTSPVVDPFGAYNRAKYQGELANLYANPSNVANTPGYQFKLDEMVRNVNREAGRTGHYLGTKRLHDILERAGGLASTEFNQERNALAQLSGSQFAPNAGAYGNMQLAGNTTDMAQGSQLTDLLKTFGDAAKKVSDSSTSPEGESQPETQGGDTPTGAEATASLSDTARLGTGMGAVGVDQLANLGLSNIADYGTASQQLAATGPMGAGAYAPNQSGLQSLNTSLADGPTTATGESGGLLDTLSQGYDTAANYVSDFLSSGTSDVSGQTMRGTMYQTDPGAVNIGGNQNYGSLGTAGAAGGALGGALGAYGLTKLAGTEGNAAVATNALGGAAGTTIGAGLGSMAAGGGFGAGATATGGAAAGGALAGPAMAAALAMMAYGGYQENQASSDYLKDTASKAYLGVDWNSPTTFEEYSGGPSITYDQPGLMSGGSIGQGYKWTAPDKKDYWLDRSVYDNLYSGDVDPRYNLYDQGGNLSGYWDNLNNSFVGLDDIKNSFAMQNGYAAAAGTAGPGVLADVWGGGAGSTTPTGNTVTKQQGDWAAAYNANELPFQQTQDSSKEGVSSGNAVQTTTSSGETTFWTPTFGDRGGGR